MSDHSSSVPRLAARGRNAIWILGWPVRSLLVVMIKAYQLVLSGWLGGQCRFYPSCSVYAEEAIREHGALRGIGLAAWRVARCGPFTDGGVDRVPPSTRRKPNLAQTLALQGEAGDGR